MWIINEESKILKICDLFNSKLIEFILLMDITELRLCQNFQNSKNIKTPNHTGKEPYNYFMVAIFPKSQARILDYNRLSKRFVWVLS